MPSVDTTTPLGDGESWTSDAVRRQPHHLRVEGTIGADQDGTLHIEQSSDDTEENWDVDSEYAIAADDGKGFSEDLVGRFWRIRYLNGATDQKSFRLSATAKPGNFLR